MRKLAVALVALVVAGGLAAGLPAGAAEDRESGAASLAVEDRANDSDRPNDASIAARAPPDLPERWQRTYGGSGDDTFADLVKTDDGGYLLVGWTGGEDRDGWVVKTDRDGRKEWNRSLGGSGTDRLWGVARTDDGYLLAGRTDADGGAAQWVVELDAAGEVRENRTLGSGAFYAVEARESKTASETRAGTATSANSTQSDSATEYLLAGWTRGDGGSAEGAAAALDGDLSTAWRQQYPTPEGYADGYVRAVVPTDAGYYLAGKVEGDSDDGWALRLADDGSAEWQATAGGPNRDDVWAAAPAGSANATPDAGAGFVLAGETESDSTGPRDGWLVKFGPEGEVEWERTPGGEGTQWLDSAMRTDEGFLFTGGSDAGPSDSVDGYVLATDDAGEPRWQRYYGTAGWDKPWPAIRAHGDGYLLAGQTSGDGAEGKDGWLLRVGGDSTAAEATDGANDTDEALRGDTATATAASEGPVPGFGVLPTALALAGLLLAVGLRRRKG